MTYVVINHEYKRYVVIENTPGYMPEDDDPATFDDIEDAKTYLAEEVERYCEHIEEADEDAYEVSWNDDHTEAYVALDRPHDLGRVFVIIEAEEEA